MAAKKSVTKKAAPKKKSSGGQTKTEKVLIENFVALQKIMVDLSGNFEVLNKKITSLLTLFEDSAKTLVKRDLDFGKKDDEEALKKLDMVLEQNKLIAKGLTLMHDTTSLGSHVSYSAGSGPGQEFGAKKAKVIEEPHEPRKPFSAGPTPSKVEELPFKVPKMPDKPFSAGNGNAK